jgi:hypothetical protein
MEDYRDYAGSEHDDCQVLDEIYSMHTFSLFLNLTAIM